MRFSTFICLTLISTGSLLCQPYQNEAERFLNWRIKELKKQHCNSSEELLISSELINWSSEPFFLQNYLIDSISNREDTLRFMQRMNLSDYRELRKSIDDEDNNFFIDQLNTPTSPPTERNFKCKGEYVAKKVYFSQPIFNKNLDLVFIIERIEDVVGSGSIKTIKSYKNTSSGWEEHIGFAITMVSE